MLYVKEERGRISLGSGRKSRGEETMDIARKERGDVRTRDFDVGVGDFGIVLQDTAGARSCGDGLEIPVRITGKVGAFVRRRGEEGQ